MGVQLRVGHTWDGVPVGSDEAVDLWLDFHRGLRIRVDAPFHGDPPPNGPPGPTDGLWEHEVVEVFVAGPDLRYTEIELGPHGHHLVLTLHGVRMSTGRCLPLDLTARIDGARWTADAWLARDLLPPRPWRVNAYAIHGHPRRYLASTPLPGKMPDFHQPARFTTTVESS